MTSASHSLGSLVELQRGTTYQSRMLDTAGPVLLGLASIERDGGFRRGSLRTYGGASPDKLLVRPGELYVSLKDVTQSGDLLGAVARMPHDIGVGRLTQDTVKLRLRSDVVTPDYLYWALRTPDYRAYCRSRAIGTTNLSISREDFLAFTLACETPARTRLACLLSAIEAKIELNRQKSDTFERIAWARLDNWDEAAERNASAWDLLSLGECGIWLSGGTPSKSVANYWGGTIPWISAKSLKDFVVSDSGNRVTEDGVKNGARLVPEGSVVFVVRGMSLAEEFRVGVTSRVVTINQDVKAIIPSQRVSGPLIGYALRRSTREVLGLADEASHGTKRLDTELLKRVRIRLPLTANRQRDIDIFDLLYRSQVLCQSENKTLAELRDALIPRLLSGELRLRDPKREVTLAT